MNLHQSFLSNENFSLNSLVAFELILTQTPINIISKKNVLNKNIKINNKGELNFVTIKASN